MHIRGKVETVPGNYVAFYENLAQAMRGEASLMVKPEEALMTIRILEACLESNRLQKTIAFIP